MAGHQARRKDFINNPGKVTAGGACEVRFDLCQRLRQMEAIEELLEADLTGMQHYADSIAEERQRLTQQISKKS